MITNTVTKRIAIAVLVLGTSAAAAQAQDYEIDSGFYVGLRGGLSFGFNADGETRDVAGGSGSASLDAGTGFMASGAFGYRYNPNLSAELEWVYRTNSLDTTTLPGGAEATDGDLASNTFFVNGYYSFPEAFGNHFTPFLGAGLGYVEEADIDLTINGEEHSYSSGGGFAYQLMAGVRYDINKQFALVGDLRFSQAPGLDMDEESNNGAGRIDSVDQTNISTGIGLEYRF